MTVEIKGLGKITASKEVLNILSSYAWEASNSYEERGRNQLSINAYKMANTIYDELERNGYYK